MTRIVVAGAGIGGLVLGIAAARAGLRLVFAVRAAYDPASHAPPRRPPSP